MCDGKSCDSCKKCGELRELPGKKSEQLKKDLMQYESGGTYWRAVFEKGEKMPVFQRQEGVRQWDADGNEKLLHRIDELAGLHTLDHADEIGFGSRSYTLVDITKAAD